MVLPTNPYIAGAPLRGQSGFFGRKDVLDWVERELRNPNTNALVLFGQRRVGKTTLLLQLQRTLPEDAFLPVYFDLQDQAKRSLGTVLADLADTIAERISASPPSVNAFDDSGRFFQTHFLADIRAILDGRRLVLLLDEFDVLDQVAERELPDSAATKALFPFLRRLMLEEPDLAFVFVVGRRAEDLTLDFTATFKASLTREVWALDRESAVELIRQAESTGTLSFSDKAIERVLELSSGHPYLIQLLCQRMWERAHEKRPDQVPLVDPAFVEETVPNSLEAGYQAFAWLWDGLSPAEKIYTAAFAEAANEGGTIAEDQVIHILATHAARLRTQEVEMAPQDLVRRRVLAEVSDHVYCFNIELFRRWIRVYKPLREVKDELDQIDPLADQTFEVGRNFYLRREWEVSSRYFRDALIANPRHLKARLFLGEALISLGEIDQAVIELEEAFALDRDEARLPLARALISKSRSLLNEGDEDAALAILQRALELSPQEHEALEMKADIWTSRGNQALNINDFETALAAYEKAGNEKKSAEVKALILEKTIASLESEALAYERASDWTGTANCYEQLLVQDVEEDRKVGWRQSLEKVKEEAELSRSFEDGLIYLEEEKWNRAQMVFADIVHKRPGYSKDNQTAIRLLEKAVEEGKSSSWWQRPPIWAVALGGVVILLSAIWGGFELSRRAVPAQSDLPVSTTASETPRSISEQAPVILATQTAIATPLPAPITNTPVAETQDSDSINALLETYYEKIDDGSVEEALALINQVIEMDPNLASAFAERGFLYYSYLDDPDAALSDLARAIELDPELDWAYHQRAKLYVDLEDMDAAMADLEQAISINPNEAEYYAELGKIYDWPIQDYVNSIAYFTKALELEPDTAWYYAMRAHGRSGLGEWDAAFADINQAIILDPNDPWFFELRGDFHREAWQLHEAVSDYSISIELDPDNADLFKKRGEIYLHHLNEFDKALADYDRAIDLDPDHLAFSDRSNLHAKLGNVEEALADFESAVDYAPNDRELSFIHKQMGDTYIYDLDNPEAALVEFNKAIDIDPDFAEAHQGRGYNYYFEHAKDHDAALADINRAIELEPNDASYYEQRSLVHGNLGNLESAIADNEDCLAIDPEFYWCHLNLGSYYDALGDAETAVTYYRDFLSLVPEAECLECQVDAVGYIQNAAPGEVELFANGFLGPFAMEFDQDRNLYVANEAASSDNGGVSKVSHNGRVSTAATGLVGAAGLAFNSAGILHVFDDTGNVYQVSEGGVLDSLVDSNDDLGTPTAIAFDANDYLYVLNCRDNGIVSVYDSEGELLEPELAGGFSCWQSIVVDDDAGVLYISDLDGNIFQIDKKTGDSSLYATTDAKTEGAMVLDNEGNLYFSAIGDDQVLRIDSSDRGVTVCLSGITTPRGLAFDSRGILYITAFEPGEIYRAIGCQQ